MFGVILFLGLFSYVRVYEYVFGKLIFIFFEGNGVYLKVCVIFFFGNICFIFDLNCIFYCFLVFSGYDLKFCERFFDDLVV